MNELELIERLKKWLESHFKESDLVLDQEVLLHLGGQAQKFRVDLLAIQSKSNVMHAFELKSKLNLTSINSAIWQVDSLYGNYKWLAIGDINKIEPQIKSLIKDKGIGLIVYDSKNDSFEIEIQPKYIDGNFLEYYPSIREKWYNRLENGSNSRSKKKKMIVRKDTNKNFIFVKISDYEFYILC